MINLRRLRIAKDVNLWMQTIGILIAALWGIYAFIYKEITAPQSAPTDMTVDLSMKRAATGDSLKKAQTHGLIPVEIKVSARNPSSRILYLLPNVWIVYGHKIHPSQGRPSAAEGGSGEVISLQNLTPQAESHCLRGAGSVVAFGGLLLDDFLKPGEVSSRTFIIYVPQNQYDLLTMRALMPTVTKDHVVELEWRLDKNSKLDGTMYQIIPGENI